MAENVERTATADVDVGVSPGVVITIKGEELYQPVVLEGIDWETARKGSPGKLTFTLLLDEKIKFQEGNEVNLFVDGQRVFFGYVFRKARDKNGEIKVTAYDQLRYFKNKTIYKYSGTATSLITALAKMYLLRVGELADTSYAIPPRLEDNVTLFDMVQNALDVTMTNTNQVYVLFDDGGKITLKNLEDMKVDLVIDAETAENFQYESSIDGETYNSIQLYYEDGSDSKTRVIPAPAEDQEHISQWGLLQLTRKVDSPGAVASMQKMLLDRYNHKTRTLHVNRAFGDIRVRAGSRVPVILDLGDLKQKSYLICERVVHHFENGHHSMDLDLIGGEFVGR